MSTRLARPHSARYRAALRSPWWRCLRWLAPRVQLGLCGRCRRQLRRGAVGVGAGAAGARMKTAPLLRLRSDGTPEMLIAGTLADGARYEDSDEAARA